MTTKLIDALEAIKEISLSDNALSTLLDFERVIDELDVYAFANWKKGEVVAGPDIEKYFVKVTLMWPHKLMPDPRGGEQLLNYNCQVTYQKDKLEYPIKLKSGEDFKPGTKVAKTSTVPVWLVEITMPKQLMTDISRGALDLESEQVDLEDIKDAYENDADENQNTDQQQQQQQGLDNMGGMPADGGMGMGGGMSPLGGPPNQQQMGGI